VKYSWCFQDLIDAHDVLDMKEEAERDARAKGAR
jgi:hypothetical protein